ncbi:MAG: glycerate kinase [Actinomycetales bacterium]|nr:glycerate kinase [Actinomycetales bacterium]
MRVLIAPDRFGPDLPAAEVATALAEGWAAGAPDDELDPAPLGDGGPGLVAAVHRAVGGDLVPVTVGVPGDGAPAALLRLPDGTVVVEAAEVLGPRPATAVRPGAAGVAAGSGPTGPLLGSGAAGGLLDAALGLDPSRVVVGVGGLAAHDAGAGLLAALGLDVPVVADGADQLRAATVADLSGASEVVEGFRRRLAGRELVVAVDTEVPLLGLHGASALLAVPDATALSLAPQAAQGMEQAFAAWVHALGPVLGPGHVRTLAAARGAGAGGGLAFGLSLLGGRLEPGAQVVASLVGLPERAARADLVLTATSVLEPHVLHDSALAAASAQGASHALPVVVVCGEVVLGRREWAAQGLAGVYPLADVSGAWRELADLGGALRERATRVARTWSR